MESENLSIRRNMYELIPDGTEGKFIPNGLRLLLIAISSSWSFSSLSAKERPSDRERTIEEFADEIRPIYERLCTRYGVKPRKSLHQRLGRIHRSELAPEFFELRMYADFIGVPIGFLILISHYIGAEIDEVGKGNRAVDKMIKIFEKNKLIIGIIANSRASLVSKDLENEGQYEIKIDVIADRLYSLFGKPDHFNVLN
jgi:hypothetical protein